MARGLMKGRAAWGVGRLAATLLAAGLAAAAAADEGAGEAVPAPVLEALERLFPGRRPELLRPAPVSGLYEAAFGPDVIYLSADGRYVLEGDLYDLRAGRNLTEAQRAAGRRALMATIDPRTAIAFEPPHPRHVVYVFTDVDCPYCRKMHGQIAEYEARGIAIRYLAYPRTGVGSPSYDKAVSVWCAPDRRRAMTEAKQGRPVPRRRCASPVERHMAVADRLGISGTPTLVLEDGTLIGGYVPPDRLAAFLDRRASTAGGGGAGRGG